MATCSIPDLLTVDPCFSALLPGDVEVVELQMLCNLLDKIENGGEVSCDPQTLITQGKCFYTLPPRQRRVVKLQLLCNILNALP